MAQDDFSQLLKSVGVQSNLQRVMGTISGLKEKVAANVVLANEEVEASIGELEAELKIISEDLARTSVLLDRYEQQADQMLPNMLTILESAIFDFRSATDALYQYDIRWFQQLLMSETAKVEFASALHRFASRYTQSNLETVNQIVSRDSTMIERIMSPYEEA